MKKGRTKLKWGRFFCLRQVFGLGMSVAGLWVLGLTGRVPLEPWISSPGFYEKVLALPLAQQDLLTVLALERWGFLPQSVQAWDSVPEPEVISPTPQAVLPKVEVQQEELPQLVEEIEGDWAVRTMAGTASQVYWQGIYVANSGKVALNSDDLESMTTAVLGNTLLPVAESPQILIYHSHGTEAYSQTAGANYQESDPFRTLDMDNNITAVGAAMTEVFRQAGYGVIHDVSLHDYPDYTLSYENSSAMLQAYLEEYPSLCLIFDVHRDALSQEDGTPYQLLSQDCPDVAQVMLVVGTDGGGYPHPDWRDNFSLALQIQQGLLDYGDFVRPITLRSSRFNQQQSTGALLLEVGGHGNTLSQAVKAGELFAQSVVASLYH